MALAIAVFAAWGPSLIAASIYDADDMERRIEEQIGGLSRVVVPGEITLTLPDSDTYSVFHEFWSLHEGQVFTPVDIEDLIIEIRDAETDEPVPVRQPGKALIDSYNDEHRQAESVAEFDIAKPGAYRLVAAYRDGRDQPRTVLAVGRFFFRAEFVSAFALLLAMIVGVVVAIVMAVVVFILRRRAKAALAHQP